jgi:flavin-dependent dehydrogenase
MIDVVVIGAGPAGAMAARECALRGVSVLLVDRAEFPRAKVCGSCVNLAALKTLELTGLSGTVADAVPLRRMTLAAGGRVARLPLPGAAITREALDARVALAAVDAGVTFLTGTRARIGPVRGRGRDVTVGDRVVTARVVIDAAGLSSGGKPSPDSRVGAGVVLDAAPGIAPPGELRMAVGAAGYVGLVAVEDGRTAIAAALDGAAVRDAGGPGPLAARILAGSGAPPVDGLRDANWRGTPPLTRRADVLAGERLFRVGDAASFVEPFTGQGIAWALAGGVAVAPLAVEGVRRWSPALIRRWSRDWTGVVRRRQRECEIISRILRSRRITASIVHLLSMAPALAGPILRSINRRGAA